MFPVFCKIFNRLIKRSFFIVFFFWLMKERGFVFFFRVMKYDFSLFYCLFVFVVVFRRNSIL